jgi:inner membrane transporter RhtA
MTGAIVSLLLAMASIQSGASVAKQLFPVVGAAGATVLRLSLATLILFVVWRPWRVRLQRRQIIDLCLYGASLGLMKFLFYLALARIPLGITVALEFTGPLTLALCHSRRAFDFLWTALAILGVFLILPLSTSAGAPDLIGVLCALGAGGCWASYIVFGQRAGATIKGGTLTSWGMFVATCVTLPMGLWQTSVGQLLNFEILPTALLVAVLSSAIPYSLEMIALKRLPTKTFSILMSIEPALAALAGLLFLREYLSGAQGLAIACIVAASAGSALSVREQKKRAIVSDF